MLSSPKRAAVSMQQLSTVITNKEDDYNETIQQQLKDFPFNTPDIGRIITSTFTEAQWARLFIFSKRLHLQVCQLKTDLHVSAANYLFFAVAPGSNSLPHYGNNYIPSFVIERSHIFNTPFLYDIATVTRLTLTHVEWTPEPWENDNAGVVYPRIKTNCNLPTWRWLINLLRPKLTYLDIDAAAFATMYMDDYKQPIDFPFLQQLRFTELLTWWDVLCDMLGEVQEKEIHPYIITVPPQPLLTAAKLTDYTGDVTMIDLCKLTSLERLNIPSYFSSTQAICNFIDNNLSSLTQLKTLHLLCPIPTKQLVGAVDHLTQLQHVHLGFTPIERARMEVIIDADSIAGIDDIFAAVQRHQHAKFTIEYDGSECYIGQNEFEPLRRAFAHHGVGKIAELTLRDFGEPYQSLDYIVMNRFGALTRLEIHNPVNIFNPPTYITPGEFVSNLGQPSLQQQSAIFPVLESFVFTTSVGYRFVVPRADGVFCGLISHVLSSPKLHTIRTNCVNILQSIAIFVHQVKSWADFSPGVLVPMTNAWRMPTAAATTTTTTLVLTKPRLDIGLPKCSLFYHLCRQRFNNAASYQETAQRILDIRKSNFFRGKGAANMVASIIAAKGNKFDMDQFGDENVCEINCLGYECTCRLEQPIEKYYTLL